MSDIKNLLSSSTPTAKAITTELVNKWKPTGLLEGLKRETDVAGMAVLLENQAKQLLKENSQTSTAANAEEWSGVALPLVRRIFGEIAAKEFVSVQPMNLPSGLIFYLDFKYGTAQPGFNKDTDPNSADRMFNENDSLFGITSDSGEAREGLYGAGRFGYTINDLTATVASGSVTTAAATSADVNYDSRVSSGSLKSITIASASTALPNLDKEGVRAFVPSATGIDLVYNTYTVYDASADTLKFVISGSYNSAANVSVAYHKQPLDYDRGDFEDQDPFKGSGAGTGIDDGTDIDIPELNLEMRSEPIVAKTRKLKAVWTPEFAQDLNAYHSVDAEAELTSMLSEYVSMEIDLEILDMLIGNALTTERWSAKNNTFWNGTTFETRGATADGYYNTQGGWFQTLGTKLQKVSNTIHQKTLRGGANFLVTSPAVATILESIPGFAADTDGNKDKFAAGVQKIGAINNRYQVYKNPYMKENIILMGYRGSQFLETGAVYSPYVPLIMTPLVYDPVNFTPRKGVMTRYAKKVVRPEFYGKVFVHGLDNI